MDHNNTVDVQVMVSVLRFQQQEHDRRLNELESQAASLVKERNDRELITGRLMMHFTPSALNREKGILLTCSNFVPDLLCVGASDAVIRANVDVLRTFLMHHISPDDHPEFFTAATAYLAGGVQSS